MEYGSAAFVADPSELLGRAPDRDGSRWKSCLGTEHATGTTLAFKAMTDRYADRVGGSDG